MIFDGRLVNLVFLSFRQASNYYCRFSPQHTLCSRSVSNTETKRQMDISSGQRDKRQIDIGRKQMQCNVIAQSFLFWLGVWVQGPGSACRGGHLSRGVRSFFGSIMIIDRLIVTQRYSSVYYFWSVDSSSMIFLSILSQVSSRPGW